MRARCFKGSFLSRSYHDRQAALFLLADSIAMIGSSESLLTQLAGIFCHLVRPGKFFSSPQLSCFTCDRRSRVPASAGSTPFKPHASAAELSSRCTIAASLRSMPARALSVPLNGRRGGKALWQPRGAVGRQGRREGPWRLSGGVALRCQDRQAGVDAYACPRPGREVACSGGCVAG